MPDSKHPHLKDHDSIVAVLFASRVATALLPAAIRSGVSPNALTVMSLVLTLVAACLLALGASGVAAAILIVFAFVLDCLDGTLARATARTSDFGRWLDSITDLVKVFALVAALVVRAVSLDDSERFVGLGAIALLGYFLCELHVQIARQLEQRSEPEYEALAAPWRPRLRLFGQKIDLAFAVGEVLAVIALTAAVERPVVGLAILAVATPVQFGSYAVRFWRFRYAGLRPG